MLLLGPGQCVALRDHTQSFLLGVCLGVELLGQSSANVLLKLQPFVSLNYPYISIPSPRAPTLTWPLPHTRQIRPRPASSEADNLVWGSAH